MGVIPKNTDSKRNSAAVQWKKKCTNATETALWQKMQTPVQRTFDPEVLNHPISYPQELLKVCAALYESSPLKTSVLWV